MQPRRYISRATALGILVGLFGTITLPVAAHVERLRSDVSIAHDAGVFTGRVASERKACVAARVIRLYSEADRRFIARTRTNEKGRWKISHRGTGTFWAVATRKKFKDTARHRHICRPWRSPKLYANNTPCFGHFPTVAGTPGNNVLEGTPGRDVIQALDGDDIITARGGNDLICTRGGDDVIDAGAGRDRINAGSGTDVVRGGRGHDVVRGGPDIDVILGGRGADALRGGSGVDVIDGGHGHDELRGGSGSDLATIVTPRDVRADLNRGFARGQGNDVLRSIEGLRSGRGNDVLRGNATDNVLIAGPGDDVLVGRAGDDVLMPLRGADVVRGGAGTDVVSYVLTSGQLKLDLHDGDGTERLAAVEGLEGSRGSDEITGTGGDDVLLGNAGNDTFFPKGGNDDLNGGPGFDVVDYRAVAAPVTVDLERGRAVAEGIDTLAAITHVHGTEFDDVLFGSSRDEVLWGHGGNDQMDGRDGEDSVIGGAGDDDLDGGDDNDLVKGEAGNDTLRGGGDQDRLEGGEGDDMMIGGTGGADFFPGPGRDVIEGPGTLQYREVPHGVEVDLAAGIATAEGTDTFTNISRVWGSQFDDVLLGTAHDDSIDGSSGDDRIEGRAGDDHLRGHSGDDTISGGEGDDNLYGDAGNDPLDGGPGIDRCSQGQPMTDCEYVTSEHVPAPSATHTPPPSEQPSDEPLSSVAGSVALQVDPSHSGGIEGTGLVPPLRERWSVDLGGRSNQTMSYPVVADGRVFVTVPNEDSYGSMLYALNANDGSVLWSHQLYGVYWWSALAYGSGRLFAQNHDGTLRAFDPASGAVLWTEHIPGQHSFPSAPVAHRGEIFTAGVGMGGTLYKIDAESGHVQWMRAISGGHNDSPTLSSSRVFVARGCDEVRSFLRASGDASWTQPNDCTGGSARTTVRYGERLYVRNGVKGYAVDAATGARLGYSFVSSSIPAFAHDVGVFVYQGEATAKDANDGRVLWTFSGDQKLSSNPLIVDGVAYVGSTDGNLYGLDARAGTELWQANVGAPVASTSSLTNNEPTSGLGVGAELLVVPAGSRLIAFER